MEIVIEQVLFDNFFIDYIVLKTANKINHLQARKRNLIFGSLVGSLFALFMPLLNINGIILIVVKILIGFAMVLILKKFKTLSELFVSTLTTFSITFLFGGLCYAVECLGIKIPISLVLFVVLAYSWLFNKVLNCIKLRNKTTQFLYDIEFEINNERYEFKGYLDSGNRLYDLDKKPIMLISKSAFEKLNKNGLKKLNQVHLVEIQTASGNNQIMVFEISKIVLKNEEIKTINRNVRIGISNTDFKDFDCLLNLDMVN